MHAYAGRQFVPFLWWSLVWPGREANSRPTVREADTPPTEPTRHGPGLFTNWSGMLWTGIVSDVSWPEMKSIAANDNRRVKQTMLRYFKRVAIFRDKHYPNRSVRDAFRVCCFGITISWKRCVFYEVVSVHVISYQ